ncbi:MAG: hypothetical protein OEV94_06195 [Deltaproteobacteria bacterium]|nr:hypothetical protein [Deltaproteobacteria bacterium]
MSVVLHNVHKDVKNQGRFSPSTGRYVPMGGGSRSKLPVHNNDIRRYLGFVGMDDSLTESLFTMAALYQHLGGKPTIPPGPGGELTKLMLSDTIWSGADEGEDAVEGE